MLLGDFSTCLYKRQLPQIIEIYGALMSQHKFTNILPAFLLYLVFLTVLTADELKPNPVAGKSAFEKAVSGVTWMNVLSDPCRKDWKAKWFLDGEIGTVTNCPEGMTLKAGPEFKNDAHHMVLWTKDSFEGDLKIEYDYTRLDEAPNCVTILYIQATGSGEGPYAIDITKWSELRKVPAMKTYYNHMNTYHMSYAAHPGTKKAYIRGRRYMPEKRGLKGTELKPDYSTPKLFATGVKHHITVIKQDRDLYMRVENPDQLAYFHMINPDLPVITEGRIGLRHMFTRSARYANFRVSRPAVPALSETASGLSDNEIQQLRDTAIARCRASFESESGKPFASREIRVDWNNRGDFTRHYIQDVIHFATRALTLNEQIEEANQALRDMCQYHLDRPQTLLEIHSFPNAPRFLARLSLLYGPNGSRTKGLITEETHAFILKTLWAWCQSKLKIADTAIEPWHTWTAHSSENHHANHFASCWAATLLLSREPAYRDLIADHHSVNEHYAAWTAWVIKYLRQRGRKGMSVEIDSSSYSKTTLAAIYLVHDLAEEPELRQLASHYMTLAWALWAQQQINGVNGGAKTRCYAESAEASENPLSAAAWYVLGSDDLPKPNRPPSSAFLTSTWKIPDVVLDIAFDISGRGTYEAIQRKVGLRPAKEIEPRYKIHLAPDAQAIVRYTYATPDFIMGSLFCDALPSEAWNNISSQNRWHGAIFSGDRFARIYPYCETQKSHYNAHWAIQKYGTLIAQKLKTSKHAKQHRVWFSREGLSEPIQEGPWYFAEADSAYAAVRVVSGDAAFEDASTNKRAHILTCADDLSPVILEVARKAEFTDFKTFRDTVMALPFQFDGTVLTYTGISNDRFKFFADQSKRSEINGSPIDLGPEKVYDSPFVQSDWDSGVVTINFAGKRRVLDFNGKFKP